ncbi:helix-turn-helix domain-containing protein [Streptomyces bobili]|uniref:helix-turn-helix domain-containing protein n=1 Tax=Streptomyces bobili TaxID=67280 RepID=UPI0033D7FFF4
MKAPHQESVLARAARILEAFSQEERVLTVSRIAHRTGLRVATASRLVGEPDAHGFLRRDGERRVRVCARQPQGPAAGRLAHRRPRPRPTGCARPWPKCGSRGTPSAPATSTRKPWASPPPVRGAEGRAVAALSVIVPDDAGAQAVVPVVRSAARRVSRALGSPTGRAGAGSTGV